ncbi:MAG TPA: hypothetical protein VF069_06755 [Streptosporangiaceae bacterium]
MVFEGGDDAALLGERRQVYRPARKAGCSQMVDSHTPRMFDECTAKCLVSQEQEQEFGVWTMTPNADKCVLEAAVCYLAVPKRWLTNLTGTTGGFAHDDVTGTKAVDLSLFFGEVHQLHIVEFETFPANIRCT